jgi:hypothetical protein
MSGIGCHNNRQMNHVIVAAATGASSGTYTYDGNNLRVKKVSGGTTTVYIFAGSKVIAEYQNGAGRVAQMLAIKCFWVPHVPVLHVGSLTSWRVAHLIFLFLGVI